MRLTELVFLVFSAVAVLQPASTQGQTDTESKPTIPEQADDSIRKLFESFSKHYNNGNVENQLKLISPKTKATLVVSHMVRLGMAPQSQQDAFSEHTEKWNERIEKFIESSAITPDAGTYGPITIAFSNWEFLDRFLVELHQHSAFTNRPNYSANLSNLKTNHNGDFASARFKIYTNGGLVAGLNGNSLQRIDAGAQPVYFAKINKKWYICNEQEFKNEILPLKQ